jgi:NADH-quinone oxidoreductase subunit C
MIDLTRLNECFGAGSCVLSEFRDNRRVIVPRDLLAEVLQFLKEELRFDMLIDITAVDYLHYPDAKDRYGLVYALLSTGTGERVYVKTFVNDPDPRVASAGFLW